MVEPIFKDQVAIVTGAGEGIGHEIARQLALQGAAVLLNDIKPEHATKAAQDICDEGGVCVGVGVIWAMFKSSVIWSAGL